MIFLVLTIAFYAYLGQRKRSLGLHYTMEFDRGIICVTASYNYNDGDFRAPIGVDNAFNWNPYSDYK